MVGGMRRLVLTILLASCSGAPALDGGPDAPGIPPAMVGPYGNCVGHPILDACGTSDALCPSDSTGSVCALACTHDTDCMAVRGASAPHCAQLGPMGTFCTLPCDNSTPCPIGMQCLALAVGTQCGWAR